MTAQNKNARKIAKRKEITRMHLAGEKGPSSTEPKHGKKWTYRQNPAFLKAIAEAQKAAAAADRGPGKTSGKAILAKAGGAAKPQED